MLNASIPFMMVLVSWLFDRQMATRRQFFGMALSVAGVLLIVARGDLASLKDFRFNPGDLLVMLSMPIWCVYSVLLRRRPRELDGLAFLFALTPIGLAALLPAYLYETAFVRTPDWSWQTILLVFYAGLAPSAGAYMLWNRGVELIGPNRAAFTNPFQPMFSATMAILLLGEPFHGFHAIGFVVIVAGWYLTSGLRLRAVTS
jgi:drug/metabolite transporter (DMT)-like permease